MGILVGRNSRMRVLSRRTLVFDLIERGGESIHHAMNLRTTKGSLPRQN